MKCTEKYVMLNLSFLITAFENVFDNENDTTGRFIFNLNNISDIIKKI